MQVDVVTRHAIRNYGSVLQTIATNQLVQATGARARFVDYRQPGYDDTGWSVANRGSARGYPWLGRAAYALLRDRGVRRIGQVFEQALRENVTLTQDVYRSSAQLGASNEFAGDTLYCAGSDQIWNVEYNVDNGPYYLDFAPTGARKFSLSSSIGTPSLPAAEQQRLVSALQSYVGVSVREADAAAYLRELNIQAEHHVDPTLAVDPSYWHRFTESVQGSGTDYVLVYQLNESRTFNPIVDAVAKETACPVLRVEYWRGPRTLRYPTVVLPSMEEFVGLFRDAAFIVTDSFHGAIFATTFSKPYVAVPPPRYGGRLESLLNLASQSHRVVQNVGAAIEVVRDTTQLPSARTLFANERAKVSSYLQRVTSSTTER